VLITPTTRTSRVWACDSYCTTRMCATVRQSVFSKRQRITLRLLIAVAIPSVVCHLSVTLVHPTQPVEIFGNFFYHTIAQGLYFSGAKNCLWGRPFPPEICVQSDPPPFQTAQFRPISAHSASTVIASEKSSIITYRKSTTRFPTSHR